MDFVTHFMSIPRGYIKAQEKREPPCGPANLLPPKCACPNLIVVKWPKELEIITIPSETWARWTKKPAVLG